MRRLKRPRHGAVRSGAAGVRVWRWRPCGAKVMKARTSSRLRMQAASGSRFGPELVGDLASTGRLRAVVCVLICKPEGVWRRRRDHDAPALAAGMGPRRLRNAKSSWQGCQVANEDPGRTRRHVQTLVVVGDQQLHATRGPQPGSASAGTGPEGLGEDSDGPIAMRDQDLAASSCRSPRPIGNSSPVTSREPSRGLRRAHR